MRPVRLKPRPLGLESSTLPLSHCAPSLRILNISADDKMISALKIKQTKEIFLGHTSLKPLVLNYYLTQALYVANIVLTFLTYECMEGKQSGSRSVAV